jgi:hypothetical protein
MLDRHPVHKLEMSMNENRTGRLTLRPPLSEQAYDIGAKVLLLTPDRDWLNPNQRISSGDRTATDYIIAVDSDRHLNGRANRLFDGLVETGVKVELGETVRHH